MEAAGERRIEPVPGEDLWARAWITIFSPMPPSLPFGRVPQKEAESVLILVMNPKSGELYACVNVPEFSLNEPYVLGVEEEEKMTAEEKQDALNRMWRNGCINDTYEPGSTFKIVTAAAGLEAGVVTPESGFQLSRLYCGG